MILGHEITPNEECMFELKEIRGHKLSINFWNGRSQLSTKAMTLRSEGWWLGDGLAQTLMQGWEIRAQFCRNVVKAMRVDDMRPTPP